MASIRITLSDLSLALPSLFLLSDSYGSLGCFGRYRISLLILFYIPLLQVKGILAAVDSTQQGDLSQRFGIKGYPTLKYFHKGVYKFDAGHARQEEQIITFLKVELDP